MLSVRLPKNEIKEKKSIVLLGANGCGKTRMSVWIENNNPQHLVHRIAAQKSLILPELTVPSDKEKASEKLLYGTVMREEWRHNIKGIKEINRWKQKPETSLLDDYSTLMEYLMTEYYEKSIEYRDKHKDGNLDFDNTTILDTIKKVWDSILIHRQLKISAGKVEVTKPVECSSESQKFYNGSQMSDGEREIFYFIGEVLAVPTESIIIIDEPENHLHNEVLKRLWNELEKLRQDCLFCYITHNLDFASSRINSKIVWVKEYDGHNNWDYEILDDEQIPESLMLEMLGNRHNTIFVEGTSSSYDYKLYSILFNEYTIIPLAGCQNVLQATKTFNELEKLHFLKIKGIVDRDRRSSDEISELRKNHVYVPLVAEVENYFLIKEVIINVMKILQFNQDRQAEIMNEIENGLFSFLSSHKEEQALLFTKQIVQNQVVTLMNKKADTAQEYKRNMESIAELNIDSIFQECVRQIDILIENRDYDGAIQIINHKGVISECGLCRLLGIKQSTYIDIIFRCLEQDSEMGQSIELAIKKYISIED